MVNIILKWDVTTFYKQKSQDTAAPSSALLVTGMSISS